MHYFKTIFNNVKYVQMDSFACMGALYFAATVWEHGETYTSIAGALTTVMYLANYIKVHGIHDTLHESAFNSLQENISPLLGSSEHRH